MNENTTSRNPPRRLGDERGRPSEPRRTRDLTALAAQGVALITTALPILSPRQTEIVDLLVRGLSDKEIAEVLGLTEGTVGWYLNKIYARLGKHSRAALIGHILRPRETSAPIAERDLTNVRIAEKTQRG